MVRIIAGSCAIENETQALVLAEKLKVRGITEMRAALFKPRTSPNDFQGIGYDGLPILREIQNMGLKTVTEVVGVRQIEKLYDYVDVFQIGARNMQNFELLKEVGSTNKPIILKRGFANTVYELLMAAEYIKQSGNKDITLCERGIRSFDDVTRNVLDIGAIIYLKQNTDYEVIADPSHSMGNRNFVRSAAKAAIAAGADGIIVEVHEEPDKALSDSKQTIGLETFDKVLEDLWKK